MQRGQLFLHLSFKPEAGSLVSFLLSHNIPTGFYLCACYLFSHHSILPPLPLYLANRCLTLTFSSFSSVHQQSFSSHSPLYILFTWHPSCLLSLISLPSFHRHFTPTFSCFPSHSKLICFAPLPFALHPHSQTRPERDCDRVQWIPKLGSHCIYIL